MSEDKNDINNIETFHQIVYKLATKLNAMKLKQDNYDKLEEKVDNLKEEVTEIDKSLAVVNEKLKNSESNRASKKDSLKFWLGWILGICGLISSVILGILKQ